MKLKLWWMTASLHACFTVCMCMESSIYTEGKCLDQDTSLFSRRFYVDENDLTFKIEVSKRKTHQLVSHIFRILLTEVIGYEKVEFVDSDSYSDYITEKATYTLQNITNCVNPESCESIEENGPRVMINLEAWLVPGFNMEKWISTGELEDGGTLGPVGRSGWFVPEYAVKDMWTNNGIILDYWRAFQDKSVVPLFDLTDYIKLNNYTFYQYNGTRRTYCPFQECDENGMYRPTQCMNTSCATLLVDFAEFTFDMLKKKIDALELLVTVAWVGDHMPVIVNQRVTESKYTLFFHKKPSILTILSNFSHVTFPPCEENSESICEFQVYQLQKLVWSKIKTKAPQAFHLIRSMAFTQQSYKEDLLDKYTRKTLRGFQIVDVACLWVRENRFVWYTWIRADNTDKTPLYLGGIFPMTGMHWRQSGVAVAAKMAVKAVNDANILADHKLILLEQDGHCVADEVMKSFITYITNSTYQTMVGILGPACTDTVEPIAGVGKHFNTIMISYSAEGYVFHDKERYPYFFRTIPENNQYRTVYMKLFQQLQWKRVAAVSEDGQKYTQYLSQLQDLFSANKLSFLPTRKFRRENSPNIRMNGALQDLKDVDARIIIGDFYDFDARTVMCEAYKHGMTAAKGYQWFLPHWFSSDWFDTDLLHTQTFENVSCTTEQMREAIEGHMSLTYKYFDSGNKTMQENITIEQWMERYNNETRKNQDVPSQYGGYTYDAVWLYAEALKQLLSESNSSIANMHTAKTSKRFAEILNSTSFQGVSGIVRTDPISEISIYQWVNSNRTLIGRYVPEPNGSDGDFKLWEDKIVWKSGNKPSDGPAAAPCIFEPLRRMFNLNCEEAIVVAMAFLFTSLLVGTISGLLIFKRRYDKRVKKTEDRMRELGLTEGSCTLDEFEMRRDHIVINRKIGEGAFGTVYGGDAKNAKNNEWLAVAVKTLKPGAKREEKLDFLSEAEVMKKFNHMNIVHLVGVCTVGEPVYNVMEFMLYGDLKTYLLARRNLVTEPDRGGEDEVTDRRLTSMALDIARGLSYLADLKYVHRDIACRNCLVNANRSVKIADFGMCRPMYDHDYYRFNKRGMLPVRWMAPESLTDGMFTPMSDVWSYGVVLYEIITFGSFPYQGLSNNQVLEHVKACKTLCIPQGCKPELEKIMKNCWCRDSMRRPQAVEIVEMLVNQPELVCPCSDMPIASMEVENTDSLGVSIFERTRIQSLSSIWTSKFSPAITAKCRGHDNNNANDVTHPTKELKYGATNTKNMIIRKSVQRKSPLLNATLVTKL